MSKNNLESIRLERSNFEQYLVDNYKSDLLPYVMKEEKTEKDVFELARHIAKHSNI